MANVERLKQVRELIANLPGERIDLNDYVYAHHNYLDDQAELAALARNECGTTGCVAGWTCTLIPLDELELYSLKFDDQGDEVSIHYWQAAKEWLDLSNAEANALFHAAAGRYRQDKEVAITRLDELIAHTRGGG